ncbi:MAG: hypothetical protein H8E74_11060 [Gammaproteobacteria bacterium]|nr:hypothetical protein [Gammaproteobacteria bacterium]
MKILFLHGLESQPGGSKVKYLQGLGHTVLNPLLPKSDFDESVKIAQALIDSEHPEIVVGSSRGGAVAMNVDARGARLILIAPAWKRFGNTSSISANTTILHCRDDKIVPYKDSAELGVNLMSCGDDHRMSDKLALSALGQAVGLQKDKDVKAENFLRKYIREMLYEFISQPVGAVDGDDPRPTPAEDEFVTGPDILAGYIVVSDSYDGIPIGYAPITRTDGPDRPFLVRTTDTKWLIPFGVVRALYPQVEDTFNWVDSKEDWRDLGIGSSGDVGNFSWEWTENEPVT